MYYLETLRPIIAYSPCEGVVFHGTHVPLEAFFRMYDRNNVVKSVNDFVRQYPQVQSVAAHAVLALAAGHRPGGALESFLAVSPQSDGRVRDRERPHSIDAFAVDWENLVVSATHVPCDQFRYFSEIERYGNKSTGIVFGRVFEFADDPEFARLLDSSLKDRVFEDLVPALFGKTQIRKELGEFAPTGDALSSSSALARFRSINPFYIEADLSSYLFHSGIYKRFYGERSIGEAKEFTRDLIAEIVGQQPNTGLCLVSRMPWGAWFDQYSCCDITIVGINPATRKIWLFAVSDSD